MEQTPGSFSEKTAQTQRISAVLSAEVKLHMFVYALLAICLEAYLLWGSTTGRFDAASGTAPTSGDVSLSNGFIFAALCLFIFYSILQHIFELFAPEKGAAIFSVLPAILLFFLLRRVEEMPFLSAAVIISALLRLSFDFLPVVDKIIDYGAILLTAIAIYLYFAFSSFKDGEFPHILMFVCLTVLTMSFIQKLIIERMKEGFPIFIFLIIGLLTLVIPVSENPIDWTNVIQAGERFSERMTETVDLVSYFFSDVFYIEGYSSGYSTLGNAGGKVGNSERIQVILRTTDNSYFTFKDPDTGKDMMRRRAIYLEGGQLPDTVSLIKFAHFLKAHDIDKDYAKLFVRSTEISIEYAYLKTKDEITPINSVLLKNEQGKKISEKSSLTHKKGYTLTANYLDIDYGSPYLISLLKEAESSQNTTMSYEECMDYMSNVLGVSLSKIISPEEYSAILSQHISSQTDDNAATANSDLAPYRATAGASERMKNLAQELSSGASDIYDKCRIIEEYLRQYTYSTAVNEKNAVSDLSNADGISRMADTFLFETGTGYCVHFASSMVMLLRLSGIPARIANGYRYAFPFEKAESYKVSGTFAHAWPEVYFDNIGWVPFEPTPAYLTALERSWNKIPSVAPATNYAPVYDEVPRLPEIIPEPQVATPEKQVLNVASVILPVIASIILLLLLLIFGSRAILKLRYYHASNDKKLIMDVEQIKKSLRRLSAEGFVDRGLLSDYVTLAPDLLRDDLEKVFGIYYRLEYSTSGKDVTQEESLFARSVREAVLRLSGQNS